MAEYVVTISAIIDAALLSPAPETFWVEPQEGDFARGWRAPSPIERRFTDLALMLEEVMSGRLLESRGPGPYIEIRLLLNESGCVSAVSAVGEVLADLLEGDRGAGWRVVGLGALEWATVQEQIDLTRPMNYGYVLPE